jgi:hypothetical protein
MVATDAHRVMILTVTMIEYLLRGRGSERRAQSISE